MFDKVASTSTYNTFLKAGIRIQFFHQKIFQSIYEFYKNINPKRLNDE